MDSLSAVELRRKLAEGAPSQGSSKKFQLPSTVAFDYPTVRSLAEYLDETHQFAQAKGWTLPVEAVRNDRFGAQRRMVAGEASKLPGNNEWNATNACTAWTIFQQQVDAVTEIPLLRFDVNECFDPTAAGVGFLTYARHASFIDGVDSWTTEMCWPYSRIKLRTLRIPESASFLGCEIEWIFGPTNLSQYTVIWGFAARFLF